MRENFIGKEEFKNQKKFQSSKKWRVEIIFGKPVGLELACTEGMPLNLLSFFYFCPRATHLSDDENLKIEQ